MDNKMIESQLGNKMCLHRLFPVVDNWQDWNKVIILLQSLRRGNKLFHDADFGIYNTLRSDGGSFLQSGRGGSCPFF
jgi:hypothetical protein